MSEADFLALLRRVATHPAARGLCDDAAVLDIGGAALVLTQDMIVAGVHFLDHDPPADIGWKLAAVNLSDLAAKGATPIACLMSYALSGDAAWDAAFLDGLNAALTRYAMPLVGGDTVAMPAGAPRAFTLTAIGRAASGIPMPPHDGASNIVPERGGASDSAVPSRGGASHNGVPSRSGARAGDGLFITGPVGDAGTGLALARTGKTEPADLIARYRRPMPLVAVGQALAPHVTAMMDVSDGLLIDAARMAAASGLAVHIDTIPLSPALVAHLGEKASDSVDARLAAATAGDDYQLLFAAAAAPPGIAALRIGGFTLGDGLTLALDGAPVPLPDHLGYQHGTNTSGPTPLTA